MHDTMLLMFRRVTIKLDSTMILCRCTVVYVDVTKRPLSEMSSLITNSFLVCYEQDQIARIFFKKNFVRGKIFSEERSFREIFDSSRPF